MFHRSARLLLRPIFEEDWQEIYDGLNDEGVACMLARVPWPYRAEDAKVAALRNFDPRSPRFAVTLPGAHGSRLIGGVGLNERGEGLELGYWIARAFWGQGYATEAAQGLLAVARMRGMRHLVAGHALDNPASGRVLRKLGFAPTGEIRREPCLGRGREIEVERYTIDLGENADLPPGMPQAA